MADMFRGSDGTLLALTVDRGPDGSPTFLFVNGLACPSFYWDSMRAAFRGRATLVSFDLKGHGESNAARTPAGATIEGSAKDAALALDEVRAAGAIVFGFSMGCQVALEMTRAHRDRVNGYVLALGAYERPFETVLHGKLGSMPGAMISSVPEALVGTSMKVGQAAMGTRWAHRMAQRASMVGARTTFDAMRPFYEHIGRIDPGTWLGLARSAATHSAAELLGQIRVPTFVVTGGLDALTPPAVGRAMAAGIRGAEYLEIPKATHTGLIDESSAIIGATHRFLARHDFV
jgi:pimeloyl-ACP methyl ester carboxylesterase